MESYVKETIVSTQRKSEKLPRSSTVLSVLAILLTIVLFVRIETVTSETRMIQSKFSEEIQQVKEALKDAIEHVELQVILSEDLDANNGAKYKSKIARRSVNTNSSVSKGEGFRDAIKSYVTSIVMETFCLAQGRVCIPGLPGAKGAQGPRGKRGHKGTGGKKGKQGIMGPPGEPGKQGMMGNIGAPGVKGEKGSAGNPGHPGTKGEPGESISAPVISVTPPSITVTENQTATFYCSAGANPKPTVIWRKIGGKGSVNTNIDDRNKLEIRNAKYRDSGSYVCKAKNVLGQDEGVVELFVEVSPRITQAPEKAITVTEDSTATIVCQAFGFPSPVIQWFKAFSTLPQGRSTVVNGTLKISRFSLQDIGSYQCKATNKLGSITTATSLQFRKKQVQDPCLPVGVSANTKKIPDSKMTSSSVYAAYYPYEGRLNGLDGWCPSSTSNRNDFIQVDMGAVRSVCAVATQGKKTGSHVESYKLLVSTDGVTWNTYQENNANKVFQANRDLNTIVRHSLPEEVQARFVRFYPVSFNNYPCMRIEIFVK